MSAIKNSSQVVVPDLEMTQRWGGAANSNKLIFCKDTDSLTSLKFILDKGVEHVVHNDHPFTKTDINTAGLMLTDGDLFLNAPAMAILQPEIANPDLEEKQYILNCKFEKISQKREIINKVEEVLRRLAVNASIRAEAIVAADELFTNAVYNAPAMDLENTLSGHSREDNLVSMPMGFAGRIFIAADEERFIIGCEDPFGTLNPRKLFSRIRNCYDTGVAASMNMASGGAGIGSFLVFNSSASYYLAVKENQKTLVCLSLPIKMSSRQRQELPRNVHFIFKKEGEGNNGTI